MDFLFWIATGAIAFWWFTRKKPTKPNGLVRATRARFLAFEDCRACGHYVGDHEDSLRCVRAECSCPRFK